MRLGILTAGVAVLLLTSAAAARAQETPSGELPRRGFVGTQIGPVPEDVRARLKLPPAQGLLVGRVDAGTAAAEAGLAPGDVILEAGGTPVGSAGEYVAVVQRLHAGDRLQLAVLREGRRQALTLTLKPRPYESHPEFDTLYRSVDTAAGRRRVIVTRPKGPGKFPALLLVGGIGCYSLDNLSPDDSYAKILYGLTLKGFATMRVEKTGMGDSEGPPCASPQADLRQEVAGYVAGLRALKAYDFVDAGRVFIFGHSIGGIVGPLAAGEVPVRGLIVAETIGTDWFEYDLTNYRRQRVLAGAPYDELEGESQLLRECRQKLYFEKKTPEEAVKENAACARYAESPAPYTYMRQLAELNLGAVWKKVDADALVIYGTSDFVTSAAEHEYLRDMINSFHPGRAAYVQVEGMAHGLERAASQRESFARERGRPAEFNAQVFDEIARWLEGHGGRADR